MTTDDLQHAPADEFIEVLAALVRAAAQFGLAAGRELKRVNPAVHAHVMHQFNTGTGELVLTVPLSPEPHVRLSLFVGTAERILFDSIRGMPPPAPPGGP